MTTAAQTIDIAPEAGELSDDALAALAVLLVDWALADQEENTQHGAA